MYLFEICLRRNERQWRDLVYCLDLLNYNEKSLAKLLECLPCFADKLANDAVYNSIMNIITAIRKSGNLKNEIKQLLDEFEQKVDEFRSKGLAGEEVDEETVNRSLEMSARKVGSTKKSAQKAQAARRKGGKKVAKKLIEEFDEDEENEDIEAPKRRTRPAGRSVRKAVRYEDDDDFDDDDDDFQQKSTKKTQQPVQRESRNKKRIVQKMFEDSDEEDDD